MGGGSTDESQSSWFRVPHAIRSALLQNDHWLVVRLAGHPFISDRLPWAAEIEVLRSISQGSCCWAAEEEVATVEKVEKAEEESVRRRRRGEPIAERVDSVRSLARAVEAKVNVLAERGWVGSRRG